MSEVISEPKIMGHDRIQQEIYLHLWNNYPQSRRCFWHTANEFVPDTYIQDRIRQVLASKQTKMPKWLWEIISDWHRRFIIKLSMRKAVGVLPGVTDLVFYWKGTLYMFDIKIGSDKLSDAQQKFITANEAQGGKFFEINSVEKGKEIIDNIFKPVHASAPLPI